MKKIEIKEINADFWEKTIFIIGVFHGDEPQGEYFINEYLKIHSEGGKNRLIFLPRLNFNNKRTNKNGVDLNRNFPTKNWVKKEKSDYWGGEEPASEFETRFLMEKIEKYKPDYIISIHSPYKIINYDGPAEEISKKISQILDYPIKKSIGYPTPGSFGTWAGIEKNLPVVTIEIDEEADLKMLSKKFFKLFDYLKGTL